MPPTTSFDSPAVSVIDISLSTAHSHFRRPATCAVRRYPLSKPPHLLYTCLSGLGLWPPRPVSTGMERKSTNSPLFFVSTFSFFLGCTLWESIDRVWDLSRTCHINQWISLRSTIHFHNVYTTYPFNLESPGSFPVNVKVNAHRDRNPPSETDDPAPDPSHSAPPSTPTATSTPHPSTSTASRYPPS